MTFALRDYQQDALDAISKALARGVRRQLIVSPTGSGKTVIFAHIPQKIPGRMLLLAHREELLTQAADKIAKVNPTLSIDIEQASQYASLDADVVLASVATLGRKNSSRLQRFPSDHFTSVVVDEAHHSAAATYVRVLEHFADVRLRLGVTATPQRGDNITLSHIFDEVVYYKTMMDLIKSGYLCDLVGYRVTTATDISKVATRAGDYVDSQLSQVVNHPSRNKLAVDSYKQYLDNERAVVFCVDVAHAEAMTAAFKKAGIASTMVVGTTDKDERRRVFADFHDGTIKVLCGVGVFVEGFDEPALKGVIMARPTRSQLFYTQAIGRSTRLYDGKDHAIIIDLADASEGKRPVGLPTLMGLPPDFDAQGKSMTEVVDRFKELEEKSPSEASRARNLDDIDASWERIDLFRPPDLNPALLEYSSLVWMESSPGHYVLNISNVERMKISENPLGTFDIFYINTESATTQKIITIQEMRLAFGVVDEWVKQHRPAQLKLVDGEAMWRKEAPSDKQIRWLKKFGVPITADLTKGQAAIMLDQLFASNPRPPRSAQQQWAIRQRQKNKDNDW